MKKNLGTLPDAPSQGRSRKPHSAGGPKPLNEKTREDPGFIWCERGDSNPHKREPTRT